MRKLTLPPLELQIPKVPEDRESSGVIKSKQRRRLILKINNRGNRSYRSQIIYLFIGKQKWCWQILSNCVHKLYVNKITFNKNLVF